MSCPLSIPSEPPRSSTILERSNERAGRDRDRKFNPLVLDEIHAAGDSRQIGGSDSG
jgi:hypothetical protein